jgi:hypothetical protein
VSGGLNLHGLSRGAINAVNPDISGWWFQSKGSVPNADGRQVPAYLPAIAARMQVQPPSARDLQFINFLQLQGVIRTVFMFANPNGIVRVNQLGGDLLAFPQYHGQPLDTWKVRQPDEGWDVGQRGWTKLFAVLQTDRLYTVFDSQGRPVLDSQGRIVQSVA